MIIAWAMIFLCESFTSQLPWSTCDNVWNSGNCSLKHDDALKVARLSCEADYANATFKKGVCTYLDVNSGNRAEVTLLNVTLVRPAHEYFHHAVLEITNGLLELGTTRWQLVLALLGCWVLVYLVIMKGPQS